jgi:hypothetical protein
MKEDEMSFTLSKGTYTGATHSKPTVNDSDKHSYYVLRPIKIHFYVAVLPHNNTGIHIISLWANPIYTDHLTEGAWPELELPTEPTVHLGNWPINVCSLTSEPDLLPGCDL